ncbi:MAG: glycosyltransferase family 4 protein [Anaerolineales bacterium]|nr:glycosyltransferase family 4 protein [Anaerolineales bacterium]
MKRVAAVPHVHGVGGMVSFRAKFTLGLQKRGFEVIHDLQRLTPDALLVIGGTRNLLGLMQAKRRGVRIVQRLNGMNWLHRKLHTGARHYLRSVYGNWNLNLIRMHIADHIVYQSEFSRDWWERVHGVAPVPNSVVYNGVDLTTYTPSMTFNVQPARFQLLLVEGSLAGGYEFGLESAVALLDELNAAHRHELRRPVELTIVGRVGETVQQAWQQRTRNVINWVGMLPPEGIPEMDRAAHLLYASDINAACPNSVIEALACGTPALAFDTGALSELVTGDSGRVVPYGANYWNLEKPDISALAAAAVEILLHQEKFRPAARARAEQTFGLDTMLDGYLRVLERE